MSSLSHGSGGSSEINERLPEDTLSALVDAEREADMLDEDDDMRSVTWGSLSRGTGKMGVSSAQGY